MNRTSLECRLRLFRWEIFACSLVAALGMTVSAEPSFNSTTESAIVLRLWLDRRSSIDARASAPLRDMTLAEKIGQL
jgi:hypothetical protein